eukprot:gene18858-25411_t
METDAAPVAEEKMETPTEATAAPVAPSTAGAAASKPKAAKKEAKPETPKEKNHTIVMVQTSKHDSTRFYFDHASQAEAIEGVLRMYETRLKELNPGAKTITYDLTSLTQYMDDLREINILSWDPTIQGYKKWDRKWLKAKLQELLISIAQPRKT